MADVTKDDLRDLRDDLGDRVDSGFEQVNARLDRLNGRVAAGEREGAVQGQKIQNLEREVFNRRSSDKALPEGDNRKITQRDVRLVGVGAAGALALIKGLPWIVTLAKALGSVQP